MLTPQEITDKVFVKAVFGGYDMTGVDDFLEAVCADYTALYKENAILKSKLKVLVEKVEEYRSTEDAMRMALLNAQRMGEEITSEAVKQKEETLRKTDLEIKAKLADTARRIADEELRLSIAAKETAKFIELSQAIMRKHSEFLTKLETARRTVRPEAPPSPAPAPTPLPVTTREAHIADAAEMIGSVMDRITAGSVPDYEPPEQDEAAPAAVYEDEAEPTKLFTSGGADGNGEEPLTPRPRFDFDDLKFGSNFDRE